MDLIVMEVEGVDPRFVFSTTREEEAAIAEVFRGGAEQVVVATDGSKLGIKTLFRLLDCPDVNFVVIEEAGREKFA